MIVVVADDFSGAAEIAGISWRYGIRTILQTEIDLSVNYDLIIIDADSRSKSEKEARRLNKSLAQILSKSPIKFVYKKIDSVLRGNVIAEIDSLLDDLQFNKILIAANNPSVGRIVENGRYYIGKQLLHETDFRFDPQFPVKSSVVLDILGLSEKLSLNYLNKSDKISGSGIFISEISSKKDMFLRASDINDKVLPVGGSDFFKAILDVNGYKMIDKKDQDDEKVNKRCLFVLASPAEKNRDYIKTLQKSNIPVCNLPCSPADLSKLEEECLDKWVTDITSSFEKHDTVACTILQPINRETGLAQVLNKFISQMVKDVLESVNLDEFVVTGGSTASHLARFLGWKNFIPVFEYSTGVVKLIIENKPECKIIIKPGSYAWPGYFLPVNNG